MGTKFTMWRFIEVSNNLGLWRDSQGFLNSRPHNGKYELATEHLKTQRKCHHLLTTHSHRCRCRCYGSQYQLAASRVRKNPRREGSWVLVMKPFRAFWSCVGYWPRNAGGHLKIFCAGFKDLGRLQAYNQVLILWPFKDFKAEKSGNCQTNVCY